jgi:C1A family cysteine protease
MSAPATSAPHATARVFGAHPDPPDARDLTAEHPLVRPLLAASGVPAPTTAASVPASIDLRAGCSPVVNQGQWQTCTACATVSLVEYMERKAFGQSSQTSILFTYKLSRNLKQTTGDTGSNLRAAMGSVALFGVVDEKYWPYTQSDPDQEPTPFCYALASNFRSTKYYRLDPVGSQPSAVLNQIRSTLSAGLPLVFMFSVYKDAIAQSEQNGGCIPYPASNDTSTGGHGVLAVGYDDAKRISNKTPGYDTVGALLIQNSWGTGWGEAGFGWLPYRYVLEGGAVDWWSLTSEDWVDTSGFNSSS